MKAKQLIEIVNKYKLCPVLLNEIIHEYTLDDINGGIV